MERKSLFPLKEKISTILDRVQGALWGHFIANAVSVPAHWYYDLTLLKRDYGTITRYVAPRDKHAVYFMSINNKEGVPDPVKAHLVKVLPPHKAKYWGDKPESLWHIHAGLRAGENDLNLNLSLQTLNFLNRRSKENNLYDEEEFLNLYLKFLTDPDSHNDLFYDFCHREFLYRYSQEKDIRKALPKHVEGVFHDYIGTFDCLIPVLFVPLLEFLRLQKDKGANDQVEITQELVDKAKELGRKHIGHFQQDDRTPVYSDLITEILYSVIGGVNLRSTVHELGSSALNTNFKELADTTKDDTEVAGVKFGIGCSLVGGFGIVAYFACKYADQFEKGVLANANVGGDNTGRGGVLGAFLGAAHGRFSRDNYWVKNLTAFKSIDSSITSFLEISEKSPNKYKPSNLNILDVINPRVKVGDLLDRMQSALLGVFTADALSMPVHWFYDLAKLKETFPEEIRTYLPAPEKHYADFMKLPPLTDPFDPTKHIVGDYVAIGKRELWGNFNHVHVGLKAGENTGDSLLMRVALRAIAKNKFIGNESYNPALFVEDFIKIFRTPGAWTDTYIATNIRSFFGKLYQGNEPLNCVSASHNVGDLGTVTPVVFSVIVDEIRRQQLSKSCEFTFTQELVDRILARVRTHLSTIYSSDDLQHYGPIMTHFLLAAISGVELRALIEKIAPVTLGLNFKEIMTQFESDGSWIRGKYFPSCPPENSIPISLYLLYKYHESFEQIIIRNANEGGDNAGRAVFLGAIAGAVNGKLDRNNEYVKGLAEVDAILREINDFLSI